VKIGVSQNAFGRCCNTVDVLSEAFVAMKSHEGRPDIEEVFHAQYGRVARVIAGVIRDPARAEELAVEVLLKWSRKAKAQNENLDAWLYRTAVRVGLNELRHRTRRERYERVFSLLRTTPTPEEILLKRDEQRRVDVVLSALDSRQAELLLLRSQDLSYDELASALDLNPASVGTFLSRAQRAFRKEYIRRYEGK
jgi:RNA polymerase sigma-70 factor, ECF subfamily